MESGDKNNRDNGELAPGISGLEIRRFKDDFDIDERSVFASTRKRDAILYSLKHQPDKYPEIIELLINTGVNFESKKNSRPTYGNGWIDGPLSSKVVKEIILTMGEKALPFLDESSEEYAKNLAKEIRKEKLHKGR